MPTEVIVWVLTALAATVVVLTRARLGATGSGAARLSIARVPSAVHVVAGGLAVVAWVAFLVLSGRIEEGAESLVGIVALVLWWVTAVAGVLILVRWLPARGRHAAPGAGDSWSDGPGLSVLAHVGLVACVVAFTAVYLVDAV